ncbi:hypothetical protein LXA43DRAFT_1032180 [Ganoderma leucocontextum]|nr:hypothetical protein LXA43DRAFT_1032180 [Ganoderma leucocontextum]
MEWWEDEEDKWFDKYLPDHDLPDGLEWTPFSVDLTTDPEVTTCMYPGLQKGLQDAIMTAGCDDLEALITYRCQYDDASSNSSCNEPTLERCPELGIYSTSCSNLGVLRSAATSQVPTDLSLELARCSDVDVLVEVRPATVSIGTTTTNSPSSYATSSRTASAPEDVSCFNFDLDGRNEGQLEESVVGVFNCQHRLFVFMILFVEGKARLLRFDRTGASMTPEFDYTQRPDVIGKFLYRLSRHRAAMGHDPTATRANEADTELFRNLHTRYHAASAVGCGLRGAAMEGWPIYKLRIEGRFSPDGFTAVPPNAPISRREYLIGQPMRTWGSLTGRGTKTHVAYDVARDQVVVIKDSWRPNSKIIRSEYDTYLLLSHIEHDPDEDEPLSIPTLLGGGDVVCQGVMQETRTSNPDLLTRIHFRLVLKEVCRPLEDFADSLELVTAISFALEAHFIAWTAAHVLHRGVSVGNVLILDEDPGGLPNRRTSKGLLADWDLARTKNEMENPLFAQKTRSGTWLFVSARLQHTGPEQLHELSDDLESFVHVLNYCAVKDLPNDLSGGSSNVNWFISDVYNYVREVDGIEKGSATKLTRLMENKPFVELRNPEDPLGRLLRVLSDLCWQHYHHIQFPSPRPPASDISNSRQPAGPGPKTLMRIPQRSLVPEAGPPAPPVPVRTLPPADPAQSPLKDHMAIANAFARVLLRTTGPGWPTDEKITRTKPLALLPASRSGKRQNGAPPYASYGVEDPKHSSPAKPARTRRQ